MKFKSKMQMSRDRVFGSTHIIHHNVSGAPAGTLSVQSVLLSSSLAFEPKMIFLPQTSLPLNC